MDGVPPELLAPPDRLVDLQPVVTRCPELPFESLTWENFERLLVCLLLAEGGVEACARYGRPGQAQGGIDVYARLTGGRYACWQARNRANLSAPDVTGAVDDFLEGGWVAKSERFVLCCRASIADTRVQDVIEEQGTRLREHGVVFQAVDGANLSWKLKAQAEIVDEFFGRAWVTAFCGEDAAASLADRLDPRRVIAMRTRLRAIYDARFRHFDPGLPFSDNAVTGSDLRQRFVLPDVEPSDVFGEATREMEPASDDMPVGDDRAWEFDGYTEPRPQADRTGPLRGRSETLSVSVEDWLASGGRSLLIYGAPGSGKSTILRCLALDLVHGPRIFPRVGARFGSRIPLLIPFALWARLASRHGGEVGLQEVIRATFGFLQDGDEGAGWSRDKARRAANALVNVDAETSGLLVESGPEELAFCHPAFREHLAGLELDSWSLERQVSFVSVQADDPRWRGAILTLVQSSRRKTEVELVLESIRSGSKDAPPSVDRRLVLADCAFAAAPMCGAVGQQVAVDALDRIEMGTDEAERRELLGLALDGPRAGPIGEEITRGSRRLPVVPAGGYVDWAKHVLPARRRTRRDRHSPARCDECQTKLVNRRLRKEG